MMIHVIAKMCHEVNRKYCESIGDDSQPPWDEADGWQQKSAIDGVAFHLSELDAGREPSPSQSHEKWLEGKRADGWKYGHYAKLPAEQRQKDYLFAAVVKAFWQARKDSVCGQHQTIQS